MTDSPNILGINSVTDAVRATLTQPGGISYVPVYVTDTGKMWIFDGVTSGGVQIAMQADIPVGADPTAVAGPVAINGTAATYMPSDAAPAVQIASIGQAGLVQPDGSTITISEGGIISAVAGGSGGVVWPATDDVVISNSTSSPAGAALGSGQILVGQVSGAPLGVTVSGDATLAPDGAVTLYTVNSDVGTFVSANITVNAKGQITAASDGAGAASGVPTAVAGPVAINGTAATYMPSDAAPAVQLATSGAAGLVQPDNSTITVSGGILSVSGAGAPLELTDGTHNLTGVTKITATNMTVGGSSSAATLTPNAVPVVSALTVSGSTETLAMAADVGKYAITLESNVTFTLDAGTNGQIALLELIQDATGSRTVAFDSSVAFGTDVTSFTASTGANLVDYVMVQYSADLSKWCLLAYSRGY
jgi:hypothetical protein